MGAPPDEYDAEAGQIVRRLIGEARNPADVERIAGDVFEHPPDVNPPRPDRR